MKPMKTIALILCLAFSFQAQGFWIVGSNDHGSMTGRALEKYFYEPSNDYFIKQIDADPYNENNYDMSIHCDGQKCSFFFLARQRIAGFNEDIDGGNTKDDPNYHCDDERITECAKIVRHVRSYLIYRLTEYIKDAKNGKMATERDFSELREKFGRSLHTLQDFYSHSNWVERSLYGKTGSIRMDNDFTDNINLDFIKFSNIRVNEDIFTTKNYHIDLSTGHTCITGPAWDDTGTPRYNNISLNNLITGFYHKSPEIYQASEYCNIPGLNTNDGKECLINGEKKELGYASKVPIYYYSGHTALTDVIKTHDGPYFTKNPDPDDEENKYFQSKEKCIHSRSIRGPIPTFIGLAKDNPWAIHHGAAVDIAVRATTAYTKHIIDEVVKRAGEAGYNRIYTDWVILTFLGYELELNFNVPIYQSGLDTLNIKEEESITISARTAFEDVETQQADLMFSFEITEGSDIISISQDGAEIVITGNKVGQASILVTAIDEDELIGTKSFEVEVREIPYSKYTKLDANGDRLPATASNWSCISDNERGIIFEAKTDDGGIHDKDNRYRWGGVGALGNRDTGAYYDDWDELVDGSNAEALCGFSDWHVPNLNELSIFNSAYYHRYRHPDFFLNGNAIGSIWTSRQSSSHSYTAWRINFDNSLAGQSHRYMHLEVWLVSGGQ